MLPDDAEAFLRDRTAREVVALNLFVALQEVLDVATHWVADAGWTVPSHYRDLVTTLGEHGVLPTALAEELAAAAGFRNLIAHRYGVVDWRRVHEVARDHLSSLEAFCTAIAISASAGAV